VLSCPERSEPLFVIPIPSFAKGRDRRLPGKAPQK